MVSTSRSALGEGVEHRSAEPQRASEDDLLALFASLKQQLAAAEAATARKTTELATQLKHSRDYIGQLMAERKQIDNKFHNMKTDLTTLLQNACNERDEARGRVLELEGEVAMLRDSFRQGESASLKEQLTALEEASTRKTTQLETQLKRAQDYIGQLMAERKHIDNKFHDMKTDLTARLHNACTYRDQARGRVIELESELAKLRTEP